MDWSRVDAVADELAATRAEVVGLALLLLGGVVVTWLVVQRPVGRAPAPVAGVSVASPSAAPATEGGAAATGVVVHVSGAVREPGVVELPGGARVVDALEAAGGVAGRAEPAALNLARQLVDGEVVHVPTVSEAADMATTAAGTPGDVGGPAPGPPSAWLPDGTLDLNRATGADLEELPGVGPVIAGRIIEFRDTSDGFAAVGQLREVSGIGEATFQKLAPLVAVP